LKPFFWKDFTVRLLPNNYQTNYTIKTQQSSKDNEFGQGRSTSNRAFFNENEQLKERGISNSGGQRSDQTSSRDSTRHPERKKSKKPLY